MFLKINNDNTIETEAASEPMYCNPVRRTLVEQPAEWYYSSYKDWKMNEKGPIEIDKPSFYIGRAQANPPRPSTA